MRKVITALALVCLASLSTGCLSQTRGMPSHGGGKRFSEEQQAISQSVRASIGKMDLSELKGKTVRLRVAAIGDEGGAQVWWPGRAETSYGIGVSRTNSDNTFQPSASVANRSQLEYAPYAFSNSRDVNYLTGRLMMHLQMAGLQLEDAQHEANAIMYVLVDVFGTNRSRSSFVPWWRADRVVSQTKLTYYVLDLSGNTLLAPHVASAGALYQETRIFGVCCPKRKICPGLANLK